MKSKRVLRLAKESEESEKIKVVLLPLRTSENIRKKNPVD